MTRVSKRRKSPPSQANATTAANASLPTRPAARKKRPLLLAISILLLAAWMSVLAWLAWNY